MLFLKLGGSLITDKHTPRAARREVIARIAAEIAAFRRAHPGESLLLGHGSGSFAHVPARRYGTIEGVRDAEGWRGFAEVWRQAAALNHLVMEALHQAGVPALAFPPSAVVMADERRVATWPHEPLLAALQAGLLPVVYGDVVFDRRLGGTILSTEDVFAHLVPHLKPERILLAGLEDGVWRDFPRCTERIPEIRLQTWPALAGVVSGSAATDVTGGMVGKVTAMLDLIRAFPTLEVWIFSGEPAGAVEEALSGQPRGTRLRA